MNLEYCTCCSVCDFKIPYKFWVQCFVPGVVFTSLIQRYGPGLCAFAGALVASAGFFVSYFASDILTVIIGVGIFTGKWLLPSFCLVEVNSDT